MKKYYILFTATAGILAAIFWYGSTLKAPQQVETVTLQSKSVSSTVLCSGKIEDTKSHNVSTQVPVIASSVMVNEGDYVQKGDVLMTVDREATVRALMEKYLGSGNTTQLVQAMAGVMDASELIEYLQNPEKAISAEIALPENVTAPASGVIRTVRAQTQSLSGGSSALFVLASNAQLQVRLSVSESAISEVRIGQTAEITGTGFKDSVYSGHITKISDTASQKLNGVTYETIVEVLLSIDDPGSDLKPGLSASAAITTGKEENVLVIPYESIRTDEDGKEFVFRYVDRKAIKTLVTLDGESDDGYTVSAGLTDGDIVITTPELLEDGMDVFISQTPSESEVLSSAE